MSTPENYTDDQIHRYDPIVEQRVREIGNFLLSPVRDGNFELDDYYSYVLNNSIADQYMINPGFRDVLRHLANILPDVEPENVVRRLYKVLTHRQIANDPDLPTGYDSPQAWYPTLHEIVQSRKQSDHSWGTFEVNMRLSIMANESERSKMLVAIARLLGMPNPGVVELGGSLGYNLQHAARYQDTLLTYQPVDVVRTAQEQELKDGPNSERFNQLLNTPGFELGLSENYDIFCGDKSLERRAEHDSFYLGERLNRDKRVRYDNLRENPHPNVSSHYGDATDPKLVEKIGKKFDLALIWTMLYQLNAEEQKQVLANAEKLVGLNGAVMVMDFVEFINGETLYFPKDRPRWTYSVWVKQMKQADRGYEKVMSVDSGRVKAVRFEEALGRLPLAREFGLITD